MNGIGTSITNQFMCYEWIMVDMKFYYFFNRTGSNPVIRKNKIFGGKNGGVLIYNSG